ncbi:hypothetical protein DQ353_04415 [Arthrobacter sp. AQ5-05]|uniref:transposase n=1 Tax=Arthrobacter sp. AQ5-05 TaxID=2184581 RepID=UPI000DCEDFB8|nr:transposase [Arthrobacter sp. AQ5-05]RAX50780.1 hypothetical protein DQ353_04415 [Arthrobacter sp. AQ5-05]
MFVTVRMNSSVKKAIASIADDAWETIQYPQTIFDQDTERWISRAEVAEVDYAAFASKKESAWTPRLPIGRRSPELNPIRPPGRAPSLAPTASTAYSAPSPATCWAQWTWTRPTANSRSSSPPTPSRRIQHCLTCPSGKFYANAAWLHAAAIAYNFTWSAEILDAGRFTRAKKRTLRTKLIYVPSRIPSIARNITLHLPRVWPAAQAWT